LIYNTLACPTFLAQALTYNQQKAIYTRNFAEIEKNCLDLCRVSEPNRLFSC